jgi:hypothetical protein
MFHLLDPTIATARERIDYAPRPREFTALRVGLVENTRKNSEAVLRHLASLLGVEHRIKLELVLHKHQRAPLADSQIAEIKASTDFAIAGVGD